jgi:hypothetical protein
MLNAALVSALFAVVATTLTMLVARIRARPSRDVADAVMLEVKDLYRHLNSHELSAIRNALMHRTHRHGVRAPRGTEFETLKALMEAATRLYELEPPARPGADWPRWWRLFSFVLPKGTRDRAFEPHFNELVEDFLEARRYRGRCQRCWLAVAFTIRTVLMILDCLRVGFMNHILRLLPQHIRRWWTAR